MRVWQLAHYINLLVPLLHHSCQGQCEPARKERGISTLSQNRNDSVWTGFGGIHISVPKYLFWTNPLNRYIAFQVYFGRILVSYWKLIFFSVWHITSHIHGLLQDCSISSALAMEILLSYGKPSIWGSLITIAMDLFDASAVSFTAVWSLDSLSIIFICMLSGKLKWYVHWGISVKHPWIGTNSHKDHPRVSWHGNNGK